MLKVIHEGHWRIEHLMRDLIFSPNTTFGTKNIVENRMREIQKIIIRKNL